MRIIIPKRMPDLREHEDSPLFFLIGPVRGGGDWQKTMCKKIASFAPDCTIAVPCRWDEDHPLARYFLPGLQKFKRQLEWERYYIECAGIEAKKGCIVVWLGLESKSGPHPGPEPYAMDTRGETGAWRIHKKYNPRVRLIVGGHPRFHGMSQIQRNFDADLGEQYPHGFPISPSIALTAQRAVLEAE